MTCLQPSLPLPHPTPKSNQPDLIAVCLPVTHIPSPPPKGGHLLNHDDVIGTRAVSFIIYLTDPDEPWSAADGGALELYPLVEDEGGGEGEGGRARELMSCSEACVCREQ